jgi:trehalose-6-phosphate synthase
MRHAGGRPSSRSNVLDDVDEQSPRVSDRTSDEAVCGLVRVPLTSIAADDGPGIGWIDRSSICNGAPSTLRLTVAADGEIDGRPDEFASSTLWPLLHGWPRRPRFRRAWWRRYRLLNERAALAASRAAPRNALVWVHGHRRLLVPAMLKEMRPDLRVGLFLHTPFPSCELFAPLPWRREVIRGMSRADVIGFQTDHDASNALAAINRFGVVMSTASQRNHHAPEILTLPASIDFTEWDALGRSAYANAVQHKDRHNDFTFLGVDSPDDGRGADPGLQAFGELLDEGRLDPRSSRFVQVSTPTVSDACDGRKELRQREQLVRRINDRHGGATGEVSVVQIVGPIDEGTRAGWYHTADALVLMPCAEGMSLVAKEFVASRIDLGASVMLSEFSGAASGLPGAILVNPYDLDAIKRAMLRARTMQPHERRRRLQSMRSAVRKHDAVAWATTFVDALNRAGDPRESRLSDVGDAIDTDL